MSKPTVIDLFCGVGGFSLGFEQSGFDVTLAVDDHEITLDTYQDNFPNTITKQLDLSTTNASEILDECGLDIGDADVVIGGPPCQGFSVMGNKNPDDDRNKLLTKFADHIVELQPDYFVMENVTGLLSDIGREHFEEFKSIILNGGYSIVEPVQILDAADYGVPQNRERVIVLGYDDRLSQPEYPEHSDLDISVEEALSGIPNELNSVDIQQGSYQDTIDDTNNYLEQLNQWDPQTPTEVSELTGMDPVNHSEKVRERFEAVDPGKKDEISQYHRLDPESKANTLRAGSSRDRGTHTPARPIHPTAPRCITVRESARLQSFPDWFQFHPTKYHGLRQIGNSVPPMLSKNIADELITNF